MIHAGKADVNSVRDLPTKNKYSSKACGWQLKTLFYIEFDMGSPGALQYLQN
jgi:hypothetical protein